MRQWEQPAGLDVRGDPGDGAGKNAFRSVRHPVPLDFHCALSAYGSNQRNASVPSVMMLRAAPEASQQLNEERTKSLLYRIGVRLVARRLVGDRVRQQGMIERFSSWVREYFAPWP